MRNRKVHVIGGGFSGLMAAYFCRRRGFDVTVSEGHHWGGLIGTHKTEFGFVETAANGFLLTDLLDQVARDLGVTLLAPKKGARKRWIANEKPQRLPIPIYSLVGSGLRLWARKAQGLHAPAPAELLCDWGDRVMGPEFQNRIILPAVQGIYGADSRSLSANLVLKPFFENGRAKRRGTVSPINGMGEWTEALLMKLRSQQVELREETISQLPSADHVILACGSHAKSILLKAAAPSAARFFSSIERLPIVSVTAFFPHHRSHREGFGILFHPDKGWQASGVLFNDQIFENRSSLHSETWIFPKTRMLEQSDGYWAEVIRQERNRLNFADQIPVGLWVSRWPQALPLYSPSLEIALEKGVQLPAGVSALGHEMGEIGLTGLAEKAQALADSLWHQGLSA